MMRRLQAWLGLAAPVDPSGICRCGHTAEVHEHFHPERQHCGPCGTPGRDNPDGCGRYRDDPDAVDMHAVCRDDQVIDAITRDDLDTARSLADDVFVQLLAGWRDDCRRTA